jgi:hypothetical protein
MADEGKRKDKRRKWVPALLAVGLVADLLLLGYVLYLLWGRMSGLTVVATTTSPNPTREVIELWSAYEQARAAVQPQAEDAQLVSASTQWQAVSEEALLNGTTNWSFVFYSPASNHSLDVVANTETAQVVNQTRVWVAPRTLAEGAWQVGPREVLLVFLAYGARPFLYEHPEAVVDLHLAAGDEGGTVWTIVTLDPEDRSLFSSLIDAETRQVLSD